MNDPVADTPSERAYSTALTSNIPQSDNTAWWNFPTNSSSDRFRMCLDLSLVIQFWDHRRVQGVL